MAKRSIPRDARRAKARTPLTLAELRLTQTTGERTTTVTGETIARLLEATAHLYVRPGEGEDQDFLDPSAIAIELNGLADVLCCLSEHEQSSVALALPCLGDQLRRIGRRVVALAPRVGITAAERYTVEVGR